MIDYTPEIYAQALAVAQAAGSFAPLFNPPTHVGNPEGAGPARICGGSGGGANITGPAVADPVAGIMFVTSSSGCSYEFLLPGPESDMDSPMMTGTTLSRWIRGAEGGDNAPEDIDGLSIWKGPSARITAIDMNTGEHLWVQPVGESAQAQQDAIRNHPLLQGVPNVETNRGRGRAIMVVTPTMLVASGQTADNEDVIYAIDKLTGERMGQVPIPGSTGYGMSSWVHEGKQYILVQLEDGLAAMALP